MNSLRGPVSRMTETVKLCVAQLTQRARFNRRKRPQMPNGFGNDPQNVVDLCLGCRLQQAETQACASTVLVQSHGEQHMAGLGGARMTSRPARDGHTL